MNFAFRSLALFSLIFFTHAALASVFVGAHPDDIELFMNRNAALDVSNNHPTVFILLTAGDAGLGSGGINSYNIPYYRARLNAHTAAVRFWQGLNHKVVPRTVSSNEVFSVTSGTTTKNVSVEKFTFGNATLYNFNFPDNGTLEPFVTGKNPDGTSRHIATLKPVNKSVTYTLPQLKQVIRKILMTHATQHPWTWANIPDPDLRTNPGDHTDHVAVAQLLNSILNVSPYNCINVAYYVQNEVRNNGYSRNLDEEATDKHIATWGVINSTLIENGELVTWDAQHNPWLGREYSRPSVRGSCNF